MRNNNFVCTSIPNINAFRAAFQIRPLSKKQLSGRELEVLQALARGWSNMQISARLGISQNTVKYHLKLIYEKLGVPNRATAVARFMERQSVT